MGKCTIVMPDGFAMAIGKLGKETPRMLERALNAGGQILEGSYRRNRESTIGRMLKGEPRSTGELVRTIGLSPMKVSGKGVYNVKVGHRDPRKDYETLKRERGTRAYLIGGDSAKRYVASYILHTRKKKKDAGILMRNFSYYEQTNAMIDNVLEHGRKNANQPARPALSVTMKAEKGKAISTVAEIYDEEAQKILAAT